MIKQVVVFRNMNNYVVDSNSSPYILYFEVTSYRNKNNTQCSVQKNSTLMKYINHRFDTLFSHPPSSVPCILHDHRKYVVILISLFASPSL